MADTDSARIVVAFLLHPQNLPRRCLAREIIHDLHVDVASIALRVHQLSLVLLQLYPMLRLELQVILFRLLKRLAHLHIEFRVVDQFTLPQGALLVRETVDDKLELHRIVLRLTYKQFAIFVSYAVKALHVVTLEVSDHIQAIIAVTATNIRSQFIIRLLFDDF